MPPTLVGIIPSRASYFWAYSTSKTALEPVIGDGALTHVLSGIAAVGDGSTCKPHISSMQSDTGQPHASRPSRTCK